MNFRGITILENDNNKKGDLLARLASDFFHALGYGEPRLNIQKSGREVDITSFHRTENRIAFAECKATVDKIGGSDINKFIGIFDAEKRKIQKEFNLKGFTAIGYFISLSGFTETAIEQETELFNDRLVLINAEKLISELIVGRIIVPIEKAISTISSHTNQLTILNYVDLLAYHKGWVWAIYYSSDGGQTPSHFALIHAEGKPLVKELTQELISVDGSCNRILKNLTLISFEHSTLSDENLTNAQEKYFKYLENELGEIHFEGLPTDKEAGIVKMKLENIFVPLHLNHGKNTQEDNDGGYLTLVREGIGKVLSKNTKLAILAKPGGGKSTLLKRIAIAYAFPSRRSQINDDLPNKNWFPIFFRCRELGDKVTSSITQIINSIPVRAEIPSCEESFSLLSSIALQSGNALLLIDGLDEISEDKNRMSFVSQLRTFIATYPSINIIVTSREAGFRVIAGSLATYCERYSVANLVESEIRELAGKWHKAIIDDSEHTVKEADKLVDLILKDNRIKVIAGNPLLLTTLLFVKRWAGYLPTKRSVLYQEMIKLLLVTWNVEGHEILDIEEAEPQLAYVAYWMTKRGEQTITTEELNECLINSRKQMPEILGYTKISPPEFIKRVELRSSLLILSGHKRLESGSITAIYEFLHLSFQEYLTAKAIVKKYIPPDDIDRKVVEIIKPNVNQDNWKEVIPLIAVLLERDTKSLIEFLISESMTIVQSSSNDSITKGESLAPTLLGSCLANEIQIIPDLLEVAIEWYARSYFYLHDRSITGVILNNKFGPVFRNKVKALYAQSLVENAVPIGWVLSEIFQHELQNCNFYDQLLELLYEDQRQNQCYVILGLMGIGWQISMSGTEYSSAFLQSTIRLNRRILELFRTDNVLLQFSICWFLYFAIRAKIFDKSLRKEFTLRALSVWCIPSEKNMKDLVSTSLSQLLSSEITKEHILSVNGIRDSIQDSLRQSKSESDKIIGVYLTIIIGDKYDPILFSNILINYGKNKFESGNDPNFSKFSEIVKFAADNVI